MLLFAFYFKTFWNKFSRTLNFILFFFLMMLSILVGKIKSTFWTQAKNFVQNTNSTKKNLNLQNKWTEECDWCHLRNLKDNSEIFNRTWGFLFWDNIFNILRDREKNGHEKKRTATVETTTRDFHHKYWFTLSSHLIFFFDE